MKQLRPDQSGTHRGQFEKNKKRIYATQSVCGICGRPVDFSIKYPHPLSPCIDHTTPLGVRYYSKSDLWWLRQAAPMAKWFPDEILRKSMAWSVSQTKYAYQKMMAMLKPLSKADIIEQMEIAYTYLTLENKDVSFKFPVLILVGEKDSTGKVKAYCKAWAEQTGYPLHFIKGAKHFANGDNPEQVNREIDSFVNRLRKEEGKS